ncbi:MAG: DnaJ domain-containing protein [Luteolibacter sp.]|jgi:curved DNA-binding protein CbpA|nr:DnaJ domain-containing protein [Luteolibacter sp.]
MDAYAILGIPPRLVIAAETLHDAYREAGRLAHPDAGGEEQAFATLREAYETLTSPSRRLRHWLELRGTPAETRGTVSPALMALFARVGEASQQAESLVRKRDEAKSSLGRALLERETHACREAVERAITMVETAIDHECAAFADYENSSTPDLESASMSARNLAFLEKWRASLRRVFPRLI